MPIDPTGGRIEPALEYFHKCCQVAYETIDRGKEPAWFRQHFEQGKYIEREYGLPPKTPLILALALHLSLKMPTADSLRRFRRKIKDTRLLLTKARARVLALRDFPLNAVRPTCLNQLEVPDGSIEMAFGPDPIDEIVHALDAFTEKLSAIEIRRRTSSVQCAVRHLDHFVDLRNPSLTPRQREELCRDLFDIVRTRHGHRSRSPDRDHEEMPRYSDLLNKGRRRTGSPHTQNRPKSRLILR
jgi:hypothetical protein